MLEGLEKEEEKKRQAAKRGHILIWYILLPATISFAAFRIWQWITGRI
jgi:hypothetical protein